MYFQSNYFESILMRCCSRIEQLAKKIHKDLLDEEKRCWVSFSRFFYIAFLWCLLRLHLSDLGLPQCRSFYVCVYDKARDLCGAHLRKVFVLCPPFTWWVFRGYWGKNMLTMFQGQKGWKEKAKKRAHGYQYEQSRFLDAAMISLLSECLKQIISVVV